MFSPKKVIDEVNSTCKNFFPESTFFLHPMNSTFSRFTITGSYSSKAINNYNNVKEEINVIKWFGDFWLYIDIRFEKSDLDIPNTFISLSVFQGEVTDTSKNQLFRAEWDNFSDNEHHPQPHWHIYSNHKLEESFNVFVEMLNEERGFEEMINQERTEAIDLKNIHFAMNGLWNTNGGHIHKINDEATIINWFQGLLSHIKYQLEYIK